MQSDVILLDESYIVENKLMNMKKIMAKLKALEAEYAMLKDEVIKAYFKENTEYRTNKGLMLASYISYNEKRFNSTNFQKDFPDIYENYKEEKTIFKFSLK